MVEKWTGRLVGRMHNERIKAEEVAAELSVTTAYVSMVLNGKRHPKGARERLEQAVADIVARKKTGNKEGGNEM